jgi:hypothetical protein
MKEVWSREERMKGQAWWLQTVPNSHTRGMPFPEDLVWSNHSFPALYQLRNV